MNKESEGIEDSIKKVEYKPLTLNALKDFLSDLDNFKPEKQPTYVLYTGEYGMHNFNFACGGIGIPDYYVIHNQRRIPSIIYITLVLDEYFGHSRKNKTLAKHSPYKCKIRMWKEFSKIELYYGTKLLTTANHFDGIYQFLKTYKHDR